MQTRFLYIILLGMLCASSSLSELPGFGVSDFENSNAPIEVDADTLDYDKPTGQVKAVGNVVITRGGDTLCADRVNCNINSGDAVAIGNVILTRGEKITRAPRLRYNFKTRKSNVDKVEVDASPFYVKADKAKGIGNDTFILNKAKITTCTNKHPHCHYHVKAKEVTVVPGEYIKAKSAVWYFGPVPTMYIPYWKRRLDTDSGWRFKAGYESKMGAYLLSTYRQPINSSLKLEHKLDSRTKRGFAVGEKISWYGPKNGYGDLDLYYLDDRNPIDDDEDRATADIDNERYRIRLRHNQTIDNRTYMLLQGDFLSDTDVLEDFYEKDYKISHQPENHAVLTRRYDDFTVSALANVRLNDFYSNVNRLPELSLDYMRKQIQNTTFYYESETEIGFLEKVFADNSASSDYSTFRLDTEHMVYQPRRFLGWLNVIPRAGYRGTYYSKTKETTTTVDASTNTITTVTDDSAALRSIVEVGVETSFKAFKTLDANRYRHIVEPYVEYTYATEPNIKPNELYQFDSVDRLNEVHQIKLGARNKLQTKKNGRPFDLVDIDLYTICHLEQDTTNLFQEVVADAEFRPNDWFSVDIDATYDLVDSGLDEINTRFAIRQTSWRTRVEHRFRDKINNLLSFDATLLPSDNWSFNGFARYEFEESRMQQEGGYIQRNLDCMSIRLGGSFLPGYRRTDGTERDDEFRVMLELWLTAFPKFGISGRSKS